MSIRKCHFNNDPFYEPAEQNQQRIIDDFDVNGDEKSTEPFDDIFARKLQKCLYVNFTFQKSLPYVENAPCLTIYLSRTK